MSLKSGSPTKPDWLPDWKDKSKYPDPTNTSGRVWAWEFLRRNPEYQQLWDKRAALPPGPVYEGHSAQAISEISERFERNFGVWTPAPPEMTVEDPKFEWRPRFINEKPKHWVLPVNFSEEIPEIILEHAAEVVVKFDLRAQIRSQCQSASKFDPRLECAPSGGHLAGLELTRTAGLSEDESHGQAPFP